MSETATLSLPDGLNEVISYFGIDLNALSGYLLGFQESNPNNNITDVLGGLMNYLIDMGNIGAIEERNCLAGFFDDFRGLLEESQQGCRTLDLDDLINNKYHRIHSIYAQRFSGIHERLCPNTMRELLNFLSYLYPQKPALAESLLDLMSSRAVGFSDSGGDDNDGNGGGGGIWGSPPARQPATVPVRRGSPPSRRETLRT